jgi:F-type H+-transporting ATPase subunit delta
MSLLGRRYARALFEAARDQNAVDAVANDLVAIDAVVEDPQVAAAITNPDVSAEARGRVLARLGEGRHQLTQNVLAVLNRRRRTELLLELREAYEVDVRESRGEVVGIVESAKGLGPAELEGIEALAGRLAGGKQVYLTVRENPALIGGIRLKLGNTLYDGSVATQLDELHRRLMEAPLH